MNKGIALARGSILGFLNSDDYYSDGTLRRVHALASTVTSPALLIGRCMIVEKDGAFVNEYTPAGANFVQFLLGEFPPNPAAYFYHKSLHRVVGPYADNLHFVMDYDFLLRAARAARIYRFDEVWGYFVLHPDCKTAIEIEGGRTMNDRSRIVAHYEKELRPWERAQYRLSKAFRRNSIPERLVRYLVNPSAIPAAAKRKLARRSAGS